MTPYEAAFPVGSNIRIRSRHELERFRREWKYHHPITDEQVGLAGQKATVEDVGFYHGGDPLYTLAGAPGFWHEECLMGL